MEFSRELHGLGREQQAIVLQIVDRNGLSRKRHGLGTLGWFLEAGHLERKPNPYNNEDSTSPTNIDNTIEFPLDIYRPIGGIDDTNDLELAKVSICSQPGGMPSRYGTFVSVNAEAVSKESELDQNAMREMKQGSVN